MQMKTHKLVTVRTVRETVTHEVDLPENLEGEDLLAVLWQMQHDGLLEDIKVEQTDVTSSSTYFDKDGVEASEPLDSPDDREVTFNEDGSIAVACTNEDDPEFGTTTYAVPDPGPLHLDTATGIITSGAKA
ncbi:hypothetical protein GFK26_18320 [Variovorax paradoxus]|uniref:Uncharacterized protein n=1 Tax=Variovorax paradoxus TaxID=34073 RepID=A0A5Q0M7M7_VARPD|nr:hypothetical protein [Variovorax paradoxus]QFZ84584.1 hypothetical protein GFK26_18320 [Variovorax paradoxus]